MKFVCQTLKAFYAAVAAALTGLGTILVGDASISDITTSQWVTIAVAAFGAFGAVWGVKNSDS